MSAHCDTELYTTGYKFIISCIRTVLYHEHNILFHQFYKNDFSILGIKSIIVDVYWIHLILWTLLSIPKSF